MKLYNFLVTLLILCLITTVSIFAQSNSTNTKHSVIIMPFDDYQEYPYNLDIVRESLVIGFLQKGFNVITNDSIWGIILDRDLRMTNLSFSNVEEIASDINVDLIIFGTTNNYSSLRTVGLNSYQQIDKPILIKIYDTKKKDLVVYERIPLSSRWGLFEQNYSFINFGSAIADKLKNMGY